jgi:hypothetical protein
MKTICTLLLLLCVNSIGYSQNHKPLLEGNQHNHSITLNKTKDINLPKPIKFKKPEIKKPRFTKPAFNNYRYKYKIPQKESPKRNESNIWKNPFFKFVFMLGSLLLFSKDSILYKEK